MTTDGTRMIVPGPLWKQSDDIVDELRRYADGCVQDWEPHYTRLLRQAADEIERLRDELSECYEMRE